MNTIHTRSWLFLGLFALSSATATPVCEPREPLTTVQATFTLGIPAGAKSVVFSESFPDLVSAYGFSKNSETMTVTLKLTPKEYLYSSDLAGATNDLTVDASEYRGQVTVEPLGPRSFSPALGQWVTLWQGTRLPGLPGLKGNPPQSFQMQVMFSDKPEEEAETLRPPQP